MTSKVGAPSQSPGPLGGMGAFGLDVLGERCQSMSNGKAGSSS